MNKGQRYSVRKCLVCVFLSFLFVPISTHRFLRFHTLSLDPMDINSQILVSIESQSKEQTCFHVVIRNTLLLVSQQLETEVQQAIANRNHRETAVLSIGKHRTHMRIVKNQVICTIDEKATLKDLTRDDGQLEIVVTPNAEGCILCQHRHMTILHGLCDSFNITSESNDSRKHLNQNELELLSTLSSSLDTYSHMSALSPEKRKHMSRILKKITLNSKDYGFVNTADQ